MLVSDNATTIFLVFSALLCSMPGGNRPGKHSRSWGNCPSLLFAVGARVRKLIPTAAIVAGSLARR